VLFIFEQDPLIELILTRIEILKNSINFNYTFRFTGQTRIQNYCMSVLGSNIYENFCEIIADQD
jgi:hypothetical protein